MGFSVSVCYTQTARAMLLIALAPMHAALISLLWQGEVLRRRTQIALALMLGASVVVYLGARDVNASFQASERAGDGNPRSDVVGDVVAFTAGLGFGGYLAIVRVIMIAGDGMDATAASVIGSLISCCASGLAVFARGEPAAGFHSHLGVAAVAVNAVLIFLFYSIMQYASKHAKAADLSLTWLLSASLAPLWVRVAGYDRGPYSWWTIAAFVTVIATLAGHEVDALWEEHRAASESATLSMRCSCLAWRKTRPSVQDPPGPPASEASWLLKKAPA